MTIDQIREQVKASAWQAVAQCGVDLSAVPRDQQEKLINAIADNVLVKVNELISDSPRPPEATDLPTAGDEKVLWEGRPFISLIEYYTITDQRVRIVRGLVNRDVENFELIRIQDIDYSQGVSERILGIGDVIIRGHDPSNPQVMLNNVHHPEQVYELLRKAWMAARKRYGLQFREQM